VYILDIKRAIGHFIRLSFSRAASGDRGWGGWIRSRGWVDVRKTTLVQFNHPSTPGFSNPFSPFRSTSWQSMTAGLLWRRRCS